jgi:hypothetical protein
MRPSRCFAAQCGSSRAGGGIVVGVDFVETGGSVLGSEV